MISLSFFFSSREGQIFFNFDVYKIIPICITPMCILAVEYGTPMCLVQLDMLAIGKNLLCSCSGITRSRYGLQNNTTCNDRQYGERGTKETWMIWNFLRPN